MLSRVNIFVSKMGDPCKVSQRDWYITLFNSDGSILEYAGTQYVVIPAPNGHCRVYIPEGKYYAIGVWGWWIGPDGQYYGNHLTNKTIFTVCCGNHECVWLYNPSAHECGIIAERALGALVNNADQMRIVLKEQGVPPEDPRYAAIDDMQAAINQNMAAISETKQAVDRFAHAFGHEIIEGNDINRPELIGFRDTNTTGQMKKLSEISKIGTANIIKTELEFSGGCSD